MRFLVEENVKSLIVKSIAMFCDVIIKLLGIVPPNREESDEDKVLKGVVRVEMVQNPADYIPTILAR